MSDGPFIKDEDVDRLALWLMQDEGEDGVDMHLADRSSNAQRRVDRYLANGWLDADGYLTSEGHRLASTVPEDVRTRIEGRRRT